VLTQGRLAIVGLGAAPQPVTFWVHPRGRNPVRGGGDRHPEQGSDSARIRHRPETAQRIVESTIEEIDQ
jgi:hypothetical protein